MGFWLFLLFLAALALLPLLLERRRKPMGKKARRTAPGQFAQLSDGLTHYQWHGPTKGPVMVMIHGQTTPSWVFAGLVPGLTIMGFRVLTYDLYGRGFSDCPRTPQTRHFFIRQLRELLDEVGVGPEFSLFGYSMGGAIATIFAAEEPDRIDRLILLAPAGMDYTPAPLLATARRTGHTGAWLWGLLGAWHLNREAKARALLPSTIPDLPAMIATETGKLGYLRSILSAERNMLTEVLEEEHRELAKMYVAVVSIWAENDTVIPLSAVGKLTEWNRDAYKFVIPGAHHSLGFTRPKEVLAAIQENLREV